LEFLAGVSGWPVFHPAMVERTTPPVEVLKSLVGRYRFAEGLTVAVVFEQEALILLSPDGDRYAMASIVGVPREFIHPDTAVRASFGGEGKGRDDTVVRGDLASSASWFLAPALHSNSRAASAWQVRHGTWRPGKSTRLARLYKRMLDSDRTPGAAGKDKGLDELKKTPSARSSRRSSVLLPKTQWQINKEE
jgi:hypothetical protein